MPYYTKFRARVLHVSFCTYKNKFVPSKCAILVCVHLAFCIFYFYITLALLRIFFFKAEKQDNYTKSRAKKERKRVPNKRLRKKKVKELIQEVPLLNHRKYRKREQTK